MSGTVDFADDYQMLYTELTTFELGLYLADSQGSVLKSEVLTTNASAQITEQTFDRTYQIPPQTAIMAFSYNGSFLGTGGGATPTEIFHDPIQR